MTGNPHESGWIHTTNHQSFAETNNTEFKLLHTGSQNKQQKLTEF